MAQQEGKFKSIFDDRLNNPPTAGQGRAVLPSNGRQPGKRSKAEYKQRSVLLKIDSWKKANRILDDQADGPSKKDFSDLMQDLLDQWLDRQAKKS